MSEILSVEGQLVGIPVETYTGVSGVVVDPVNKTIHADETVIWTGSETMSSNPSIQLSESVFNFEQIAIYGHVYSTWGEVEFIRINPSANPNSNETSLAVSNLGNAGDAIRFNQCQLYWGGNSGRTISVSSAKQFSILTSSVSTGTAASTFTKVIGINRKAQ